GADHRAGPPKHRGRAAAGTDAGAGREGLRGGLPAALSGARKDSWLRAGRPRHDRLRRPDAAPRPVTGRLANRRIRLLLAVFALVFGATLLRAIWLQGVQAQTLGQMAASQHRQTVTLAANRGTIYA